MEKLKHLQPNFKIISEISKNKNVVGFHAFALINNEEVTAVCRNFAPLYGINEESATGTSNCSLACYLFKHGIKKNKYIFEQGYELNCPSKIVVLLQNNGNDILNILVGGRRVF